MIYKSSPPRRPATRHVSTCLYTCVYVEHNTFWPTMIWIRAWPQGALEASSHPSCRGFLYIYIYIYGAYPGAYLVTCVSENLYIYTAHTLAHTPFLNVFAAS